MTGYRLATGAGREAVNSYDDEAASFGDDLFYLADTGDLADTGARRPRQLYTARQFFDMANDIHMKIVRCDRMCVLLYSFVADIEDSPYSKQILDDIRCHAADIDKNIPLYTNKFHSMFRKFLSFDKP